MLLVVLALAVVPPLAAQAPAPGGEDVRRGLIDFVTELEGLPGFDPARIAAVRDRIASLDPQELELVARRANAVPRWQRVPEVLHSLVELQEKQQRQLVASYLKRRMPAGKEDPTAELERFRTEFLFLIARLRVFAPVIVDPDFEARLDRAERNLKALAPEHLPALRKKYYQWAPAWKARLISRATSAPPPADKLVFDDCDGDCSFPDVDCFVDEIGCDVTEAASQVSDFLEDIANFVTDIFDDVSDFFTQTIPDTVDTVGDFFTELGNDLIGLLEDLLEAALDLIPDSQELLELLGLDDIDSSFYTDLVDGLTLIEMPCPDIGSTISGYGEVGSPRAEYVCKRGIDWLAEKLYDLVPDDVYTVPVKLLAAIPYYPIKYFCLCMGAQSSLSFADAQEEHRELVAERLDAALSTRASEESVTELESTVDTLDSGVDDVQGDVDDVVADIAIIAGELATVDGKVDDLASSQDDQYSTLEDFLSLELRLDIEENLLTDTIDPLVSFQLPEDLGGFLEVVSGVVEDTLVMTLAAGEEVGEAELWLAKANNHFNEGSFEKAYDAYRQAYREAVKE